MSALLQIAIIAVTPLERVLDGREPGGRSARRRSLLMPRERVPAGGRRAR